MESKAIAPSIALGTIDCACCGKVVEVKTDKNRYAYAYCSPCGHNIKTTAERGSALLIQSIKRFHPGMEKHVRDVYPRAKPEPGPKAEAKAEPKPTAKPKPAPLPSVRKETVTITRKHAPPFLPYEED